MGGVEWLKKTKKKGEKKQGNTKSEAGGVH